MAQVLSFEYAGVSQRDDHVDPQRRDDLARRTDPAALERDMSETLKSIVEQHGGMISRIASSYEARP